jgi:hypothetical protein
VLNLAKRQQKLVLKIDYGDEALSRSSVFERFKLFKDGHEDLQDDRN